MRFYIGKHEVSALVSDYQEPRLETEHCDIVFQEEDIEQITITCSMFNPQLDTFFGLERDANLKSTNRQLTKQGPGLAAGRQAKQNHAYWHSGKLVGIVES